MSTLADQAPHTDQADLAVPADVLACATRAEAALLGSPHILVCTDRTTGVTTSAGPFATGHDALAVRGEHEAGQQPAPGVRTVFCTLAPLLAL